MLIKPHALDYWIRHFYGYGSWQAPIWFVAHEESGGDLPEEVAEKLDFFYQAHQSADIPMLCDLREVYRQVGIRWESPRTDLFPNRYAYRFGDRAVLNKVWENLIRFTSGYRDRKLPEMLGYQRHLFAQPSSEEALLRLFPLPGASHHGWNYNWLELPGEYNFLKSRPRYEEHMYPERIRTILDRVHTHQPEIVLMYGMNNIHMLKQSVSEFFPAAKFTQVKAVKLKIPQHHRTHIDNTLLIITTQIPALRHRRIETGFDWYAFGEAVRTS